MSFKFTAAHSSRIKKSTKPPSVSRSSSSPFTTLPRRKPVSRSKSIVDEAADDEFDRLDDIGLVETLATDLTLRDVAQAVMYIRGKMWSSMPEERGGMNSKRIAEVLQFRRAVPPLVTVSHVQALLRDGTSVEREIVELVRGGVLRKIVVGGRGGLGEMLVLTKHIEEALEASGLDDAIRQRFSEILKEDPMALKIPRARVDGEDAKKLMHAGFLTSVTASWTTTDAFSVPGQGSRSTATSLSSISRAASGSMAAVGGEGAVHAAGGSGGGVKTLGSGDYSITLPATGSFLKLVAAARAHLVSLLSRSKFREAPQTLLRQRWDGGISTGDGASIARRNRGEFDGVLPGRTKKWKTFYGIGFDWILGECVGAGLVEVFDTGSVGRGVRAL
ncbi:serine-threonine protein kinase 19-domain-containing protein [Bisporella sp. PMI_857]|nr:serine-threonine protein kinase 19-domain-containing protein [Bisporella sp. PMI_857]